MLINTQKGKASHGAVLCLGWTSCHQAKVLATGKEGERMRSGLPPSKETKVNTTFTSNLEKIIMKFVLVVLVLLQKLYMVLFCPLQIYPDKKAKLLKKWPWC